MKRLPKITLDTIFDIQSDIMQEMQNREKDLRRILESEEAIVLRWQALMGVILPVQIEAIAKQGFSKDAQGLCEFNQQLKEFASASELLEKINEKKWEYLLQKAFGLTSFRKVTLKQVRDLVTDIAAAMSSEEFLSQVDQIDRLFPRALSLSEKRKYLLELIFPLDCKIMEKHGFVGEAGYIEAQRAIMDHYYDPTVMLKTTEAQEVVFKRAKI